MLDMDNKFKAYWNRLGPQQRAALAVQAGTSKAYLSQIAFGHRRPSAAMCHKILAATGSTISVRDLRPDFFTANEAAA